MQIIVDVMAWKPLLDYQRSWYFKQSYEVSIRYLATYASLLREINTSQMSHEFDENQKIKQYLDLSHKAADAYANMEWSDAPVEQIKTEIGERRYVQDGMRLDSTVPEAESDGPSASGREEKDRGDGDNAGVSKVKEELSPGGSAKIAESDA